MVYEHAFVLRYKYVACLVNVKPYGTYNYHFAVDGWTSSSTSGPNNKRCDASRNVMCVEFSYLSAETWAFVSICTFRAAMLNVVQKKTAVVCCDALESHRYVYRYGRPPPFLFHFCLLGKLTLICLAVFVSYCSGNPPPPTRPNYVAPAPHPTHHWSSYLMLCHVFRKSPYYSSNGTSIFLFQLKLQKTS